MKIDLHASRIDVDEATRDHLDRRLGYALSRFADVVRRVDVRFEDVNGPRGGCDKFCRIRVLLDNGEPPATGTFTHEHLTAAIDLAADRAARAVARAVDRRTAMKTFQRRRANGPGHAGHRDVFRSGSGLP